MTRYISSNNDLRTEFITSKNNNIHRIETFLSAERSMDAIKRKNSKKKRLHTYSRYIVYVNINIYTYIYIYLGVCVCLYDLAMPICIILDSLDP